MHYKSHQGHVCAIILVPFNTISHATPHRFLVDFSVYEIVESNAIVRKWSRF